MAHGAARPVGRAPCASKALRKHLTHRLSQNSQRPSRRDECHLPLSPSTAHSISRRGCKSPALYSTKISRWIHQPCKSYCSRMLHQGHSDGKGQMPGPPAQEGPAWARAHLLSPSFQIQRAHTYDTAVQNYSSAAYPAGGELFRSAGWGKYGGRGGCLTACKERRYSGCACKKSL